MKTIIVLIWMQGFCLIISGILALVNEEKLSFIMLILVGLFMCIKSILLISKFIDELTEIKIRCNRIFRHYGT